MAYILKNYYLLFITTEVSRTTGICLWNAEAAIGSIRVHTHLSRNNRMNIVFDIDTFG